MALSQEHGLDLASDEAQPVLEVGARGRFAVIVVEVAVAAVGELAGQVDEDEGGVAFLADAAFGPGVERFGHGLAGLVELFDTPSAVIEITEGVDGISVAVDEGRGEAVCGVGVLNEAQATGAPAQCGGAPRDFEGDGAVGVRRGDEGVEPGAGMAGDAEHEVEAACLVSERHGEADVAAVVDDDVAFGGMVELGERGLALVAVADEVEVNRDAVVEAVEGADQALRVVGAVGDAVAAGCEFPGALRSATTRMTLASTYRLWLPVPPPDNDRCCFRVPEHLTRFFHLRCGGDCDHPPTTRFIEYRRVVGRGASITVRGRPHYRLRPCCQERRLHRPFVYDFMRRLGQFP